MNFVFPVCALYDLHNSYPFRPDVHKHFNQLKTKFTQVSTPEKKNLNFKHVTAKYRNMVHYFLTRHLPVLSILQLIQYK